MIVVIPEKRRDKKTSFIQLISYTTIRDDETLNDEITNSLGEKSTSKTKQKIFNDLINYVSRNNDNKIISILERFNDGSERVNFNGVICQHNCMSIESAAYEMNCVASLNKKCIDPVYHFILSWQSDETPSDDKIFSSVQYCLSKLNMQEHQYLAAIHNDTDNIHCHVSVNRINPYSLKSINIYNDVLTLHKACRELELIHNFKVDNGFYIRDVDNNIIRSPKQYKDLPLSAKRIEKYSDKESFYSYSINACRQNINNLFKKSNFDWKMIHDVLNESGLELRPSGKGLCIFDKFNDEQTPIKASLIHPFLTLKLESIIGKFETTKNINNECLQSYNQYYHARDKSLRDIRRKERADLRKDFFERYEQYKNNFVPVDLNVKDKFKNLSTIYKEKRANVKKISDRHIRKLTYHILSFERERDIANLRLELKKERSELKEKGLLYPMSLSKWAEQQASLNSDVAAISYLRGRAYRQKRREKSLSSNNAIIFSLYDDIKPFNIDNYTTHVMKNGLIIYKQNNEPQLIDKGDRIEIFNALNNNSYNLITAFNLASQKKLDKMYFEGEPNFINEACRLLPIYNKNAHLNNKQELPLTDKNQALFAVNIIEKNEAINKDSFTNRNKSNYKNNR